MMQLYTVGGGNASPAGLTSEIAAILGLFSRCCMARETRPLSNSTDVIQRMLNAKRIAVVGLSDDPSRPSFGVARYLQSVGKQIIPVNPRHREILGATCYAALEEIPGKIDLVNVFRRPEYCADVVRSAVAIKAGGVWLQSGITNEEARQIAESAGIDFVQDRCIMVEHMHFSPLSR